MLYFLSDTHLGSRAMANFAEHQARFCTLLNQLGEDATQIFLVGDIFDFWFEYVWPDPSKRAYQPLLNTLRSLTDKGIQVHFFTGNHDMWTYGYLASCTGVQVHNKPFHTVLAGQKVYLSHGDWETSLYLPSFRYLRAVFHNPLAQFLFRLLPPCLGNAFGYTWAKHSREKELSNPYPYAGETQEALVQFAKAGEENTLYIFGHRHIELDLLLARSSRIVILGDTFQHWTYGVMDEQGHFTLKIQDEYIGTNQ